MAASKEFILLGIYRVVIMIMGWIYSKNFLNNIDGTGSKYLLDRGFLFLVFVIGRLGFISLEVVVLVFCVLGIRIINMGNIWIVNR